MDLEKLGHLMDEAKGADVAFYLLLAFGCICPGFIILFIYKPELVLLYDVSKLLLICFCISGSILLFYLVTMCACIVQAGGVPVLRPCLMVGAAASVISVCLCIRSPSFAAFTSDLLLWAAMVGYTLSISIVRNRNWFFKYFCNMGMLFLIVGLKGSFTAKQLVHGFLSS